MKDPQETSRPISVPAIAYPDVTSAVGRLSKWDGNGKGRPDAHCGSSDLVSCKLSTPASSSQGALPQRGTSCGCGSTKAESGHGLTPRWRAIALAYDTGESRELEYYQAESAVCEARRMSAQAAAQGNIVLLRQARLRTRRAHAEALQACRAWRAARNQVRELVRGGP